MAVKIFLSSSASSLHCRRRRRCSLRCKDLSGRMKGTDRRFARTTRLFGAESSKRREGWSCGRKIGRERAYGKGMKQGIISGRITFFLSSYRETPICSTVHIPRTMRSRCEKELFLSFSLCLFLSLFFFLTLSLLPQFFT